MRPARFRLQGETVVRPALSDPELVDFPGIGTLEAFNTDGLRTLLTTCDVPELREKTLRYPGHVEKMRMLRDLGFFSEEPVDAEGARVRPIAVTAQLLFGAWRLEPGMPELTVMRVEAEGLDAGIRLFVDLTRYLERWPGGEKAGDYYKLVWETATLEPCPHMREDLARGDLTEATLRTHYDRAVEILAIAERFSTPPQGMTEESFQKGLKEHISDVSCAKGLLDENNKLEAGGTP